MSDLSDQLSFFEARNAEIAYVYRLKLSADSDLELIKLNILAEFLKLLDERFDVQQVVRAYNSALNETVEDKDLISAMKKQVFNSSLSYLEILYGQEFTIIVIREMSLPIKFK